jgi:hypothetical protein
MESLYRRCYDLLNAVIQIQKAAGKTSAFFVPFSWPVDHARVIFSRRGSPP